jgi:hypothetical protein
MHFKILYTYYLLIFMSKPSVGFVFIHCALQAHLYLIITSTLNIECIYERETLRVSFMLSVGG